jgi:hypothetical protein
VARGGILDGMTQSTHTFTVRPIAPDVLVALRRRDDAGRAPLLLVDADGGSPLRCCLRQSRPGEPVALLSYAPLRRWAAEHGVDPAAYDEVGPVFVHREPCDGPAGDGFPGELRDSPRMLRAYNSSGRIARGVLVEPFGDFDAALDELFADSDVAVVHGRALEFGCFTFEVSRRVPAAGAPNRSRPRAASSAAAPVSAG